MGAGVAAAVLEAWPDAAGAATAAAAVAATEPAGATGAAAEVSAGSVSGMPVARPVAAGSAATGAASTSRVSLTVRIVSTGSSGIGTGADRFDCASSGASSPPSNRATSTTSTSAPAVAKTYLRGSSAGRLGNRSRRSRPPSPSSSLARALIAAGMPPDSLWMRSTWRLE